MNIICIICDKFEVFMEIKIVIHGIYDKIITSMCNIILVNPPVNEVNDRITYDCKKEPKSRLLLILKNLLARKNNIKDTWAIPVPVYSFGVIK